MADPNGVSNGVTVGLYGGLSKLPSTTDSPKASEPLGLEDSIEGEPLGFDKGEPLGFDVDDDIYIMNDVGDEPLDLDALSNKNVENKSPDLATKSEPVKADVAVVA